MLLEIGILKKKKTKQKIEKEKKKDKTSEGVYWAAIKPRPDRNYVLYENEKFTTTYS